MDHNATRLSDGQPDYQGFYPGIWGHILLSAIQITAIFLDSPAIDPGDFPTRFHFRDFTRGTICDT